jgi:O-antigen ligase
LISLILTFPYLFQKNKLLASGYCLLVIFAFAISFSRSVWIVSILICLWLVIQWWRKIKIKKPLGYTVWSVLFVVGCWLLVVGFFVYFGAHFSTNEAFFQRWQLMRAAFLMIKSAPLAGVGLNNFIVCLPAFWSMIGFTYWLQPVHNFYLLLASETGFVGLLILGWFLFLTFKNLWKIENCSFKGITPKQLQIALIVILLLGLVDHYWLTLQQTQLLLAIVLGLSWSSKI